MSSRQLSLVPDHRQDQSTVVCRGDRDLVRPALGLGNRRQVTVGAVSHCLTALPELGVVTGDKANSVPAHRIKTVSFPLYIINTPWDEVDGPTVVAVRCTGRCEVGDLELDICILARNDLGCRCQGQEGGDCCVLHLPE